MIAIEYIRSSLAGEITPKLLPDHTQYKITPVFSEEVAKAHETNRYIFISRPRLGILGLA